MTPAEYAAVMLLIPRMSVARREAARRALVEGETEQAIGADYGWTRRAVSNAEAVVWKTFQSYQQAKTTEAGKTIELPRGWVYTTIAAPQALMNKLLSETEGKAIAVWARRGKLK